MSENNQKYVIGQTVSGTVTGVNSNAIYLEVEEGVKAVIYAQDLLEMPKNEIVNIVNDDPGALDGKVEDLEGLTVEVIANVSYDEYNEVRKLNPRKILQKYY